MKRIQIENRTDLKSEIPLEAPYSLFIDPSNACNFKCKFCMNGQIEKPKIMEFDLYKKIIDDLQEFKNPVKTIRLYGFGEPLLNNNFCDMVHYAKRSDKVLNVDTTTNASLINPKLAERLIFSGIDRINISIEGLSSKKYSDFTGKEINFDLLVENLTYLHSLKEDTVIFIKIAGDYLTEDEKLDFFKIFKPISDGCDIEYTMNCWYDTEVEGVNQKVGVYGQPLEDIDVCSYIFYSMMIQASGQVSVCFLDWNKKMLLGDVNKNSVKEIWSGDKFNQFRIDMLKGNKNKICKGCSQLKAGMPVNIDAYKNEILERII
jgi:radical SAM protein with 4Fe4S-binding SPASM domain